MLDCGREGGGRRPKIRWMKAGMGVLGGDIIRSMDWRHAENKITGKCEVEVGSKPSKSGCCCSNCDSTSDRAADQRIYGISGGGRQRQQVAKAHSHSTKKINNKIVCQLYLDINTDTVPQLQSRSVNAIYCTWMCSLCHLTDERRGIRPNQARHCILHLICVPTFSLEHPTDYLDAPP